MTSVAFRTVVLVCSWLYQAFSRECVHPPLLSCSSLVHCLLFSFVWKGMDGGLFASQEDHPNSKNSSRLFPFHSIAHERDSCWDAASGSFRTALKTTLMLSILNGKHLMVTRRGWWTTTDGKKVNERVVLKEYLFCCRALYSPSSHKFRMLWRRWLTQYFSSARRGFLRKEGENGREEWWLPKMMAWERKWLKGKNGENKPSKLSWKEKLGERLGAQQECREVFRRSRSSDDNNKCSSNFLLICFLTTHSLLSSSRRRTCLLNRNCKFFLSFLSTTLSSSSWKSVNCCHCNKIIALLVINYLSNSRVI